MTQQIEQVDISLFWSGDNEMTMPDSDQVTTRGLVALSHLLLDLQFLALNRWKLMSLPLVIFPLVNRPLMVIATSYKVISTDASLDRKSHVVQKMLDFSNFQVWILKKDFEFSNFLSLNCQKVWVFKQNLKFQRSQIFIFVSILFVCLHFLFTNKLLFTFFV